MHWLGSFLFFALLGLVQTLSSTGNRLLVVSEDVVAKEKYSVFWGDLESEHSHDSTAASWSNTNIR